MKEEDFRKIFEDNYVRIYRICFHYFGNKEEEELKFFHNFMQKLSAVDRIRKNFTV